MVLAEASSHFSVTPSIQIANNTGGFDLRLAVKPMQWAGKGGRIVADHGSRGIAAGGAKIF